MDKIRLFDIGQDVCELLDKKGVQVDMKQTPIHSTPFPYVAYGVCVRRALIGSDGGFGCVAKVIERRKGLNTDPEQEKLLSRELGLLKELSGCDGVVKMLGSHVDEKHAIIIMSVYDGDLEWLVKNMDGSTLAPKMRDIMRDMMNGFWALHSRKIIHRDVKPGNFLVKLSPSGAVQIAIADFGHSKLLEVAVSKCPRGSIFWDTPEFSVDYSTLSDIYAAGLCIYYILTSGKVFFDGFRCENYRAKCRLVALMELIGIGSGQKSISDTVCRLSREAVTALSHSDVVIGRLKEFQQFIQKTSTQDLDIASLISKMLSLMKEERPTAADIVRALSTHPVQSPEIAASALRLSEMLLSADPKFSLSRKQAKWSEILKGMESSFSFSDNGEDNANENGNDVDVKDEVDDGKLRAAICALHMHALEHQEELKAQGKNNPEETLQRLVSRWLPSEAVQLGNPMIDLEMERLRVMFC